MKPKIWESITFEIGLFNLGAAIWFEICKVIDVWGQDPDCVVMTLTAIVSGIICFLKGSRLWFWREELRNLLRCLGVMWNKESVRYSVETEKMAEATCFVTKIHTMTVAILCLNYAIQPYILLLTHQMYEKNANVSYDYTATVYTASYPWATGTTLKYVSCVTWEQFVIYFVALYWIAADVMFAQLTTHMALQFQVLWNDLERITISDNGQQETNEIKLKHQLATIAKRHYELHTHCEMIERIYNPIVFLTLSFTAVHMCLGARYLQKEIMYGNWKEVTKSLLHTVSVIIQGFIYCGYSNKLTLQSSRMAEAAYNCPWMDRGKDFKVMLGVIMMRSQKPFICTAYGFFALNLMQLAAIFKGAGSYFALLQSVT
ncbi:odorant receptor 4-like [Venturia canescens]|uniref:odorant receptor 4-like n=1 Tax=Venturia canescens TaxID=32260 RepID=UPI001C9C3A2C|nr:odorant receptor 4-like [Venturia canescens]